MKFNRMLILMMIILLNLVAPAFAISILIWDRDEFVTFIDPENYQPVDCQYGIEKALSANDYSYTATYRLQAGGHRSTRRISIIR